jgi:hypothetical protein
MHAASSASIVFADVGSEVAHNAEPTGHVAGLQPRRGPHDAITARYASGGGGGNALLGAGQEKLGSHAANSVERFFENGLERYERGKVFGSRPLRG